MRQIEINLGKACDNACVFCANGCVAPEERKFFSLDSVIREVDQAAQSGYEALGFLGGEPTLFSGLEEVVAHASRRGFRRISLCTNGRRLADKSRLRRLVQAGVTRITLSIHDYRESIEDRINQRRGSFAQKLQAIDNIVNMRRTGPNDRDSARGLIHGFALNTCLHGGNITELPALTQFFKAQGVGEIRFNLLRPEHRARRSPKLVPPLRWVSRGLLDLVFWNESRGKMTLTVSDVPFCGYPAPFFQNAVLLSRYVGELRDLETSVSMSRSGGKGRETFSWQARRRENLKAYARPCNECPLRHLCEGIWAAYLPIHGTEDLVAGRAALPRDVEACVASVVGPITTHRAPKASEAPPDQLIRVTRRCNQRCVFCNNNESAPGYVDDLVGARQRARRIHDAGLREVSFTGGEPTLMPWLRDAIQEASSLGFHVGLQTNAVVLDRRKKAEAFVEAGLSHALVSLHAPDPDVSDGITEAPGTFHRTVAGIHRLLDAGAQVNINTVVCRLNARLLPEMARFLTEEWGGRIREWVVSFMAPEAQGAQNAHLMVRYRDAAPHLEEALSHARQKGLRLTVPGVCGAPVCVLGEAAECGVEARGTLEPPKMKTRYYPAVCSTCAQRRWCSGVWREYGRRFGEDELMPLKEVLRVEPAL